MSRMRPFLASLLSFVLLASCLLLSQAQEFQKKKKGKAHDEDAKMAKLLEKAYKKKAETERDKVIKEFSKLGPDRALGEDFSQWFERVAPGQAFWDRQQINHMGLAEIFDRMAQGLNNPSGRISRDQFLLYAREFWQQGRSPSWKEPKGIDPGAEAEKIFRHLDSNGDGYLADDELPDALRQTLIRWDADRDGRINAREYYNYFGQRVEYLRQDIEAGMMAPARTREVEMFDDERPRVFRAGKLPAGLPPWFVDLDHDRDGQIALWEWRRQKGRGRTLIGEFQGIDRNEDGFITPEEALRYAHQRQQQAKRGQP